MWMTSSYEQSVGSGYCRANCCIGVCKYADVVALLCRGCLFCQFLSSVYWDKLSEAVSTNWGQATLMEVPTFSIRFPDFLNWEVLILWQNSTRVVLFYCDRFCSIYSFVTLFFFLASIAHFTWSCPHSFHQRFLFAWCFHHRFHFILKLLSPIVFPWAHIQLHLLLQPQFLFYLHFSL